MRAWGACGVMVAAACSPGGELSTAPTTSAAGSTGVSSTDVGSTGVGDTTGAGSQTTGTTTLPCNGAVALCDRSYDTVVFPGTHNSVAATESGFAAISANQTRPIETQLLDGIRVLLLDVTYDGDETALCHGPCTLGSRPHIEVLMALRQFLTDNPREVITIIYEDTVDAADIEADFVAASLVDVVYTHGGGAWPTLGAMIEADTRLVVTAENGGPPPAWLHHVWDIAWDTPYSWTSVDAFDCSVNRGSADHPLFLLNHWISTDAGLPSASEAATANALAVLSARVEQCEATAGRRPGFIAVDYYEQGDLFAVVDALNAE
ncbi:MAG: hypothetical protein AAF721_34890 [Myxococcota bacterium]